MPSANTQSSESALEAYQRAHAQGDLEAVVALVDFRLEAIRELTASSAAHQEPDLAAVDALAQSREAQYRTALLTRGFGKGLDIANCAILRKVENTPTQHTFVMQNTVSNGVNIFTLEFFRGSDGWRLVRRG